MKGCLARPPQTCSAGTCHATEVAVWGPCRKGSDTGAGGSSMWASVQLLARRRAAQGFEYLLRIPKPQAPPANPPVRLLSCPAPWCMVDELPC